MSVKPSGGQILSKILGAMVGDDHAVDTCGFAMVVFELGKWFASGPIQRVFPEPPFEDILKYVGLRIVRVVRHVEEDAALAGFWLDGYDVCRGLLEGVFAGFGKGSSEHQVAVALGGKPVKQVLNIAFTFLFVGYEAVDADNHSCAQSFEDTWGVARCWG